MGVRLISWAAWQQQRFYSAQLAGHLLAWQDPLKHTYHVHTGLIFRSKAASNEVSGGQSRVGLQNWGTPDRCCQSGCTLFVEQHHDAFDKVLRYVCRASPCARV